MKVMTDMSIAALVSRAPVEKHMSALHAANEVLPTSVKPAFVSHKIKDTPAQVSRMRVDTPNYRWNQNPINPPIEARLYHAGEYAGSGRICTIGLHGMFVGTTSTFDESMYLQVHFVLPGEHEDSRFCLDAQVIHSLDTGVVLLMDILDPATREGIAALSKQATMSADALH